MKSKLLTILIALMTVTGLAGAQTQAVSREAGLFTAAAYGQWTSRMSVGNSSTGSASITLSNASATLPDGRVIVPFSVTAPITVDAGSNSETVTPTAVSGCYVGAPSGSCTITASFSNTHGQGAIVQSGTAGLQEAINDAFSLGGGQVVVEQQWLAQGGTNTVLAAAVPYSSVSIADFRGPSPRYWNLSPTAITYLAAPTTLTAVTALPSATPVGAYGTGTYHLCIAYVDIAGQEGVCSADFSEAGLATGSFIFSAPAASAGAVGYTIYISLTGGTYSLAYQVPLTNSICTLTKLETITPACAVANSTYGQSGAAATVTAITVSTSPVDMQLGGVSGTLLTGNPNGRTTYAYVASSHVGSNGVLTYSPAFTVGGIGSATPIAMGSVNLPAGLLNQFGATIRVCGKFLNTDVNSSVQNVDIYWDGAGSNVAGSPVKIGALAATGTGTAAAYEGSFCDTFSTSVSGAGATAGSIIPGMGFLQYALVSTGNVVGNGADKLAAAVALLNLAGGGGFSTRLSIVHTNATGNATPQLQSLTIEVL